MKWSLRIARLAGISVYVHWTLLLLLAWIGVGSLIEGGGSEAIQAVLLMVLVFTFIVLHEMGHALTARRFGIRTRDITLLPIGGVAQLERMPEDPRQEFLVAIAGPAVNVAIAGVAAIVTLLLRGTEGFLHPELIGHDVLMTALYLNLGLATFNLLPAFPMDGGRILRALLVGRMGYVAATETAATVGQFLAILLGVAGLFTNPMLLFIALFVFLGAQQEALQVQMKSVLNGVPVREAMRTHFLSLYRDEGVAAAVKEFLAGNQHDFPVVDECHRICGMVYSADILSNLNDDPRTVLIGEIMQTDCGFVAANAMLEDALKAMHDRDCSVLPVVQAGRVVGLISLENIGAFLMIQSAVRRGRAIRCPTPLCQPFSRRVPVHVQDREDPHVESPLFAG